VRRWTLYAGISALLVGFSALFVGFLFDTQVRLGIWAGLGSAWLVQLVAFAILVAAARPRAKLVLAGWTAGTVLRLVVLGLLGWLSLGGTLGLPAEATMLALAFGLFALLLLEPVVFRHRLGAR